MRSSQRQRKAKVLHEDFMELESDSEGEQHFENNYGRNNDVPTTPSNSLQNPMKKRKNPKANHLNSPIVNFNPDENRKIFEFLLSKIRSSNPKREGRVAMGRVELTSSGFWKKCRKFVDGVSRDATSYRQYFHQHLAPNLHTNSQLSLQDKADLYYALHLRPDKCIRQKLIDNFEVEFDGVGFITGSLLLDHWDAVHPDSEDSEPDDDGDQKEKKKKTLWPKMTRPRNQERTLSSDESSVAHHSRKFSEFEDGEMWRIVVEELNSGVKPDLHTAKYWAELKERYEGLGRRDSQTYKSRFLRNVLPNIHRMPFDIQAKAALYFHLVEPVPEEFRQSLHDSLDLKITPDGFITAFPECPAPIVLQSDPSSNTLIGITSKRRPSTLKPPEYDVLSRTTRADLVAYSSEEDSLIWQYILFRTRTDNRNVKNLKIRRNVEGLTFWKQMAETVSIVRSPISLKEHFINELAESIMSAPYDLKTKIELYFALNQPVEDDVLKEFKSIADVFLNEENGTIRHVTGETFLAGRSEMFARYGQNPYDAIQEGGGDSESQLNNTKILTFLDSLARQEAVAAAAESNKVPYVPARDRPKKYNKRGQKKEAEKAKPIVDQGLLNSALETIRTEGSSAPSTSSASSIGSAHSIGSAPSTSSAPRESLKPAQLFGKTLIPHRRRLLRGVIAMSGRDSREMAHLLDMDPEDLEEDSEDVVESEDVKSELVEPEDVAELQNHAQIQAELDKIMEAAGLEQKPEHLLVEAPPTLDYSTSWEAEPIAPMSKRGREEVSTEPFPIVSNSRSPFGPPPPLRLPYVRKPRNTVPRPPAHPEFERALHILENQMKAFSGKVEEAVVGMTTEQKETYGRWLENLIKNFENETRQALIADPSAPPPWSPFLASRKRK